MNPGYQDVCSGTTGHADVVRVEFDPQAVSLDQILRLFFGAHDPTTLNRQGNDVGTQYRSIILYADDRQRAAAERLLPGGQYVVDQREVAIGVQKAHLVDLCRCGDQDVRTRNSQAAHSA